MDLNITDTQQNLLNYVLSDLSLFDLPQNQHLLICRLQTNGCGRREMGPRMPKDLRSGSLVSSLWLLSVTCLSIIWEL